MQDTSDFIRKKQMEIILAKPLRERMLMTFQLMEDAFSMAYTRIKRQNPDFSNAEIKVQRLKEFYYDSLSPDILKEVEMGLKAFDMKQ